MPLAFSNLVTLNIANAKRQSGEHLKLLELCYRYAYLNARQQAGLRLTDEEAQQLTALRGLFEGDSGKQRRQFRRFPMLLHAVVKTSRGWCSGQVLNMSGAGMYLALTHDVEAGATVQVRVGSPGSVEYLFTCTVIRSTTDDEGEPQGFGLSFCCVPLEMRRAA